MTFVVVVLAWLFLAMLLGVLVGKCIDLGNDSD